MSENCTASDNIQRGVALKNNIFLSNAIWQKKKEFFSDWAMSWWKITWSSDLSTHKNYNGSSEMLSVLSDPSLSSQKFFYLLQVACSLQGRHHMNIDSIESFGKAPIKFR